MALMKPKEQVPETLKPGTSDPRQGISPSKQILNIVVERRGYGVHQQLEELSLSTIYSLIATLMQCFSLGCLCVSISLLKWVIVVQPFYHRPKVIVTLSFGVPSVMYFLETWNVNSSEMQKKYFLSNEDEDIIEPVMVTVCFLSLLSGFIAFLLGFVEVKRLGHNQPAFSALLHILSGIFIIGLLVLCCWCLMKIQRRVNENDWKIFRCKALPGESFYITLMSLVFIVIAVMFSLRSTTFDT